MSDAALSPLLGQFIGRMPPALRAAVEAAGVLVRYPDGATIHQRGDRKPGLSIVSEGTARLSTTDAEGERSTYIEMKAGDSFGEMTLFLDIPRAMDAVAVGETVIREVSRDRFTRLLDQQPALRDHLLVTLASQLSLALERLDDQRRLPAAVRLAKTLIVMAERDGAGHVARGSQSGLAEAIATSRVTAGKALAELADAELVETGYRTVHIPDIAALEDWIAERSVVSPLVEPD
ncbi:Crp/Fnr family transcriptional regulator [Parasphingopyxis algicola]|uniref:Crp/Fnr family transcriptional regulator n=1 Tax=Parasphingopyxis algicola TaxID=2026624 RepID=UPI00159FDE78|nr:Crp/Fnr family transcriptional regulator [Parasphingopyxis algicola]QLC24831.1 Crp/Fnr family transcriptional regulator [Parasphingopyxis algicola]